MHILNNELKIILSQVGFTCNHPLKIKILYTLYKVQFFVKIKLIGFSFSAFYKFLHMAKIKGTGGS